MAFVDITQRIRAHDCDSGRSEWVEKVDHLNQPKMVHSKQQQQQQQQQQQPNPVGPNRTGPMQKNFSSEIKSKSNTKKQNL